MTVVISGTSYHNLMSKEAREAMNDNPWYIGIPESHYSPTSTNSPIMDFHSFKTMEERDSFAYGWRVGSSSPKLWKFTKEGNWNNPTKGNK
jgi:hypothetical protein